MAGAERAGPRRPTGRREVTHAEVHTDETAAHITSALHARAVTAGNHIYFGAGQFAPHLTDGAQLLRHELAHVGQQRRGISTAGKFGAPGDEFERAADQFAATARTERAALPVAVRPPPVQRQPFIFNDPRFNVDPNDLVTQLRAAIDFRRRQQHALAVPFGLGLLATLRDTPPEHGVLDVLRMGSTGEWVTARASFETATHELLLHALRSVLTEREMGAALPRLRGVVPTADLLQVWSGVLSSDLPGVIRAIQRMPDEEALPLLAEFRAGTSTGREAFVNAIQSVFGAGKQYDALRAFAARIKRLAGLPDTTVTAEDRAAANEYASWVTVYAAFVRIQQADDEQRVDWAYLAVAGLTLQERHDLSMRYVADWRSMHFAGRPRAVLDAFLTQYYDDVQLVLAAVDAAAQETAHTGHDVDEAGRGIAAESLGRTLADLHAQAANASLSEEERTRASDQLTALAADPDQVDRILALPDGVRMATEYLGLPPSELARRRVLRTTSGSDVIAALRGLAPVDVDLVLSRPEVQQHLHDAQLDVEGDVRRILGAYAQLQGAQPEGPFVLTLPGSASVPVEAFVDPLVTVAAYEAHRAAVAHDLAGVVAALRNLRPWQRVQLQDDRYFLATRELLRSGIGSGAARTIEEIVSDPNRSMSEASDALLAAGFAGDVFHIADERLLTEALAVDPDQRRLLRYHYVLEQLADEDVAASGERGLAPGPDAAWLTRTFELQLPQELEARYSQYSFALGRLDPTVRLPMENVYLGEPEITRADMTPDEMTLEAEFMRLRVMRQLEALDRGVDASGVSGFSPETLAELRETFQQRWAQLSLGGWTRDSLALLAAAYYDVLDAIERNRRERNSAAEFISNLAATVAGIVVILATAGTATPFVVTMLAGAEAGGLASVLLGSAFRDYTPPEQTLLDLGHGAVTAALTVAGEVLAKPISAVAGARMAAVLGKSAVSRAITGATSMAIEGAINGAVSGAGEAVFATAIDRQTWEHGIAEMFARFLSAAVEGAFVGGVMGGVAAPVLGGVVAGAGQLTKGLSGFIERIGVREVPAVAVEGLEHVVAAAEAGHFGVALDLLDQAGSHLSAVDRDAVATELYRRALGSAEHRAEISPDVVRRLEDLRAELRDVEVAPPSGEPPSPLIGRAPIEEALSQLEDQLGAADLAQVRRVLYGEIRLPTAERLVRRFEFENAMHGAISDLLTPQERLALPAFEVRVLPPESFSGMFRTTEGRAVTLIEDGRPVIYVRSDAAVRTYALQEAAHLRQLVDPEFAAHVRFLNERNLSNWATSSAEDRLNLLGVQRRLEIDAQERVLVTLQREAPFAESAVTSEELDNATRRLEELRLHEAEAARITPLELSEMNAGVRPPAPHGVPTTPEAVPTPVTPEGSGGPVVTPGHAPTAPHGGNRPSRQPPTVGSVSTEPGSATGAPRAPRRGGGVPKGPRSGAVTFGNIEQVPGMKSALRRIKGHLERGGSWAELGFHDRQQFLDFVNRDPATAVRELNRQMDVLSVRAEEVGSVANRQPDVAHNVAEAPPKWTREEALGRTPSKTSQTGQQVRERMRSDGRLETRNGEDWFHDRRTDQWYPADRPQTHMGHTRDAVDWWNEQGRYFAPRSPEVRGWMTDPSVYEFEYGPANSAAGAGLGQEYAEPVFPSIDTSGWNQESAVQESAVQESAVQESAVQEGAVQEGAVQESAVQESTTSADETTEGSDYYRQSTHWREEGPDESDDALAYQHVYVRRTD